MVDGWMKCNKSVYSGLVAVEGIDGSGTTTLVKGIEKILNEKDIEFHTGFEPTDGSIGKLIREALAGTAYFQPETLAMLFAADRHEHLLGRGGIVSLIGNGGIYITDRYFFSSLAYQSMEVDFEKVQDLNAGFPLPEKLIFLDLPVEKAMQRLSKRSSDMRDIYENTEYLTQVSIAYRKAIALYENSGMRIVRMDACRPAEELVEEALEVILK